MTVFLKSGNFNSLSLFVKILYKKKKKKTPQYKCWLKFNNIIYYNSYQINEENSKRLQQHLGVGNIIPMEAYTTPYSVLSASFG